MNHGMRFIGWTLSITLMSLAGIEPCVADESTIQSEVDVVSAMGIPIEDLQHRIASTLKATGGKFLPVSVVLRNARDECLVNRNVTVTWEGGSRKVSVPRSGVITFPVNTSFLKGLKIQAPEGYIRLRQFTFPVGPAFQAMPKYEGLNYFVERDSERNGRILQQLMKIRAQGNNTSIATLQKQLQRKHFDLKLAEPSERSLTPEQIYRQYRSATVVLATLVSNQVQYASGFILDRSGIVVTNYHVIQKESRHVQVIGVFTYDGQCYPVKEVLAASQANDVAMIRIDADDLPSATLSHGEPVGAPVTIISHPAKRFFFLTHGNVCRYASWINHGEPIVAMAVTAEFIPGSSGGPVFAANGSVAGIVSTIRDLGSGMVVKQCIPAQSIRALLKPATLD